MAKDKKYYWLKLQEDFFTSLRIKRLRKMAGGDTYTIIYLKMQLKAIKSNGVLTWTGLEEDFADELALDIDEAPDDVKVVLQYLLSCGLAETSDNVNFLLPYAIANTGSETEAAQRMRDSREKMKLLAECNDSEQSANNVRECYTEIEIEDKPKRRGGVFQKFAGDDKELSKALKEFNEFRNKKKRPLTDEAKERFCKRIEKYPREQWVDIIHRSIDKGWIDIYPLDEKPDQAIGKNAPISNDPNKWAKDNSFTDAIKSLMNG